MTRQDFIWKWLAYGIVLALVAVFNYYVLAWLPLGAVPLLIQVTVIAVGVLEGPRAGAGFGIAAGVALAALTHGTALWVCVLPLVGWICGLLALYVLRRDFVGYLLACLGSGLLYEGGRVILALLRGTAGLPALLRVAGPEYLWTTAFAVPVYGLCHLCCRRYGRIYHE